MSEHGLLRKDQLEISLHNEKKLIEEGVLREDNPLDDSNDFRRLCDASRRGDPKLCQEMISKGVNINAKDRFDYTPLILASLCGHYETVQLLLESGALCERDTFQGERCLYNALNDRIRNLLLSYDYSKSTDPLQPLAAHLNTLLHRSEPATADITITTSTDSEFRLHKFILAARSPYFRHKLVTTPSTSTWKLPPTIPPPSFAIALKHLYLGELPRDLGGPGSGFSDSDIVAGVDRISKHLEIQNLSTIILSNDDRRLARQRRQDEVHFGRDQIHTWFRNNVLKHAIETPTPQANDVKWDRDNGIFADILLRADEQDHNHDPPQTIANLDTHNSNSTSTNLLGIPTSTTKSRSPSRTRLSTKSKLYPSHKAMLIRSDFFHAMFHSAFAEAQPTPHLQIIPLDMTPQVLEIVLTHLYTETVDFGLDIAVDVLFAADMLFLEKLKAKAALVISSLGNGTATGMQTAGQNEGTLEEEIDVFEILRAAWTVRVQRLEEFAARYMAYRLEEYIDTDEFAEIVRESAGRIGKREETDSIELLDDIRYYLSERFRLRFEDTGFEELEEQELAEAQAQAREGGVPVLNGNGSGEEKVLPLPNWGSEKLVDEGVDMTSPSPSPHKDHTPSDQTPPNQTMSENILPPSEGVIRTLDGEIAGDEFEQDALNYQILLGKIDLLLERLKLDA